MSAGTISCEADRERVTSAKGSTGIGDEKEISPSFVFIFLQNQYNIVKFKKKKAPRFNSQPPTLQGEGWPRTSMLIYEEK